MNALTTRPVFLFVTVAAVSIALARPAPAQTSPEAAVPSPFPANPAYTFTFSTHPYTTGLANLLALEQAVVIATDDAAYLRSPHRAGKMNPLTGLPFARSLAEESLVAVGTNLYLRNPHRSKLLIWTSIAFPLLERSIIGSIWRPWKTTRLTWSGISSAP